MPHINEKVSNYDKVMIYVQTAKKICRGAIRSAFFKRKKLPIFIGKHVDITHRKKYFVEKTLNLKIILKYMVYRLMG